MSGNGPTSEISLNQPATHRGVRVARNLFTRFARLEGMPAGDVDALALVLSELLANAIDHGGGGAALTEDDLSSDVRMRATLTIDGSHWMLSVTDQGGGDPDGVNETLAGDCAFDIEDDRGRGLFLLKASVDALHAERSADGDGLTFHAKKAYVRAD